jgi:hypothetical protein
MKAILKKISLRKEIGLSIGEHEIAACQVANTLFGRYEISRTSARYEPDALPEAIEAMLGAWTKREDIAESRVTIGFPALRVFFSTRVIQAKNHEASPHALLHELIQSPTVNIDDMAVDLIKPRAGHRPLASVVSCRKRYLAGIMSALEACRVSPSRAEPAPCALMRAAGWKHRPPRKARSYVRVFLGPEQGIAVLAAGANLPLMWRPFPLPKVGPEAAILAAIASVRILGGYCGLKSDIDAVILHGRPELGAIPDVAGSAVLQGIRVVRHDGPSMEEGDVALGLALSPGHGVESFNLVRSLVGRNKFLDIFPWGQVVLQFLVLLLATLFFQDRGARLRVDDASTRVEDAKFRWAAALTVEKLQAERKDLESRVDAIRAYLSGRVVWAATLRALAARLTPELAISSVQGFYELDSPGSIAGKPRRSLVLRLLAPIPRTGTLPPEIDAFLRRVREDPLVKKDFPEVDLIDLRWIQSTSKSANASFGVMCQPGKIAAVKPAVAVKAKAN